MANTNRYEVMRKLLNEHGYKSQVELARALVKTEHYKNTSVNSARAYINQVFNEKTTLSDKLERALLELCNNDKRIINRLRTTHNPDKNLELALESKLNGTYELLRRCFLDLDWKGKSDMCADFEDYVKSYFDKKK